MPRIYPIRQEVSKELSDVSPEVQGIPEIGIMSPEFQFVDHVGDEYFAGKEDKNTGTGKFRLVLLSHPPHV